MELKLNHRMEQTASPQMIQSMRILQMSMQELLEYLQQAIQENPVLEQDEMPPENSPQSLQAGDWSSFFENGRSCANPDADEDDPFRCYGQTDACEPSLFELLAEQINQRHLAPLLKETTLYLAACLDESGWLEANLPVLFKTKDLVPPVAEQALAVLQSLEPAGIGARNLKECLLLQLKRLPTAETKLARCIVDQHLDALAKHHYGQISKQLNCSMEDIQQAISYIRNLNPRPGADYSKAERTDYLTPDLVVLTRNHELELFVNDAFFPRLHLNDYYLQLSQRDTNTKEVQTYLTEHLTQAKWIIKAIQQRRSTLLSCAQCILDIQQDFFLKGPGHLVPLTMSQVARRIGVHESTVSRTLKNKYLQCSIGIYPLSYFFPHAINTPADSEAQASADKAKCLLKAFIQSEDAKHPLSDQKLCDRLAEQGCPISRRTVAKYRDELHIPNASGRKRL